MKLTKEQIKQAINDLPEKERKEFIQVTPKKDQFFIPKIGQLYYCVGGNPNHVQAYTWFDYIEDNVRLASGIFKTVVEAEEHLQLLKTKAEIIKKLNKKNDGWIPNWDNPIQGKWVFTNYQHDKNLLNYSPWANSQSNLFCAKSDDILQGILAEFGDREVARVLGFIK